MQKLSGVFCAFWTPTDSGGEILWPALEHNLDFVLRSGIHGFMALGTTGEYLHLSFEQRKQIVERLVRTGLPVFVNVSDPSHRNALEMARAAKQFGAAAAAVMAPWYFPMAQRDVAEFIARIGKDAEMPLVLYNYPEVTGKKLEPDTIRAIASRTRVIAMKQSGTEFAYHHDLLRLGRELSFDLFTGNDTRFEEALRLGCAGSVGGLMNALPDIGRKIWDNFQAGQPSPRETAFLTEVAQSISAVEFPLNVKALLEARGLQTGELKNPVSPDSWRAYEKLRDDFKLLLSTIL